MASINNAVAITSADAQVDACDVGSTNPQATLTLYSGTVPTNVDTALSGNTVLAQLDMSNPAFGAAADDTPGAIATANAISDDTAINATGTVSFYRILNRDNTPIIQGTAGEAAEELVFNASAFVSGATASVSSLTHSQPEA